MFVYSAHTEDNSWWVFSGLSAALVKFSSFSMKHLQYTKKMFQNLKGLIFICVLVF